MKEKKKYNNWLDKLTHRYRLVVMNDHTFEEESSFVLSRLNVYSILSSLIFILAIIICSVIIFTPVKEYLPGYEGVSLKKEIIDLRLKVDSLENNVSNKDKFLNNLLNIINDNLDSTGGNQLVNNVNYDTIKVNKVSSHDSLMRIQVERENQFSVFESDKKNSFVKSFHFFPPIGGYLSNEYSDDEQHFGVDIVAPEKSIIKATMDGTIVFSDWTVDAGYVVVIQHNNDFISFYKHNSVLLKKNGNFVKGGDAIAIIGNTGERTTGTHLHFELWHRGVALNPSEYIVFN